MEFSIAGHPGDFFPVSVTFSSRKSYCDLKVTSTKPCYVKLKVNRQNCCENKIFSTVAVITKLIIPTVCRRSQLCFVYWKCSVLGVPPFGAVPLQGCPFGGGIPLWEMFLKGAMSWGFCGFLVLSQGCCLRKFLRSPSGS